MTDQDEFRSALAARAGRIESHLDAILCPSPAEQEIARPARLLAAMRHAVFNGGKRLRPFLVLEVCDMLGGSEAAALDVAAAFECVHCYSLVHDDLPAMDDDDLRRGQPTVHVAFDEATAILAGDALLTIAFGLVASDTPVLGEAARCDLVVLLARAAGLGGMAGGQMLDLIHEAAPADAATVTMIHAMKTGALISAACEAGAVVAGDVERAVLRRFGEVIGLAFQLADDLLDVTADTTTMGKATGKDAAAGKKTLVQIHGAGWAQEKLDAYVGEAEELLKPYGERAKTLRQAARFVAHRRS